jgi:hypothetical protein
MSYVFEPKLDMPVGAASPDKYDPSLGREPSDNFTVSRHRDGSVASTYGDLSWDISAYNPEGQSAILNFAHWLSGNSSPVRDQLSREARHLLFLLMWVRQGSTLSVGTLRNYLSVVRAMARFAENESCQICDLLSVEKRLWKFVDAKCSGWMTQTLGSMLPLLAKIDKEQLGFEPVGDKLLHALHKRGSKYRGTLNQHAPIPTRIYSKIITQLLNELIEWEPLADSMLLLAHECTKDPRMGRHVEYQRSISNKLNLPPSRLPTFEQLATKDCMDYFHAKKLHPNVKSLSRKLSEIQLIAKLTIQTFTGMRDDEALSLPYHCLETTVTNGKVHYVVLGRTTKLNNGRVKRTRWVTNQNGYFAISLAQKIAETIYAVLSIEPHKSITRTNDHPLFVSPWYLNFARTTSQKERGRFNASQVSLVRMADVRKRLQPIIEEADIRELEQIDPHRAWRSEVKFQVGRPWIFGSHQLRRSLALYAQRSGLVSLPSLRRQLQHITDEMSRYYAKGSSFAKDFIGGEKTHFGREWQVTQSESSALSYVLNVLLSDDVLFGGYANWVSHRLKGDDGTILVDRETTLLRFKKGELAYKETMIGGCTNVNQCDKIGLNWLHVDCLKDNCRNLVGNLPKLEKVIVAQEKMVLMLDPNSIEYRTEVSDLKVLVTARDEACQQRNGDKSDSLPD